MEKSKLGISVNLFAALIYFLGGVGGAFTVVIAAGYVLLREESERLRKTAVKAVILTICIAILTLLIQFSVMSITNILIPIANFTNQFNLVNLLHSISSGVHSIIRIVEVLIFVTFGFGAYRGKDIKIRWIDNILDKHF